MSPRACVSTNPAGDFRLLSAHGSLGLTLLPGFASALPMCYFQGSCSSSSGCLTHPRKAQPSPQQCGLGPIFGMRHHTRSSPRDFVGLLPQELKDSSCCSWNPRQGPLLPVPPAQVEFIPCSGYSGVVKCFPNKLHFMHRH